MLTRPGGCDNIPQREQKPNKEENEHVRTTAIMNLKGGTAKTVTAINTAAILAHDYGERVLLIDADSQANLTEFVGTGNVRQRPEGGISDLLRGDPRPRPVKTKIRNVELLPADETLMELDVSAAGNGRADPMALASWLAGAGRERRWDRVLIDCPPAFSAAAMAALIAADNVVIPVKLDAFGIRGLANLLEQVHNMQRINPDLEIAGVLPTMYYPQPEQAEAMAALRADLSRAQVRTFHQIARSTKVDSSTFEQEALIYSHPKTGACRDYRIFVRDLLALEGGEQDGV